MTANSVRYTGKNFQPHNYRGIYRFQYKIQKNVDKNLGNQTMLDT